MKLIEEPSQLAVYKHCCLYLQPCPCHSTHSWAPLYGLSILCRDTVSQAVTPVSAVTDGRATPHAVTAAAMNAVTP